jgi:hypothetical protein
MAHLAPDEQSYGCHADAGIVKNLFVRDVEVLHSNFFSFVCKDTKFFRTFATED